MSSQANTSRQPVVEETSAGGFVLAADGSDQVALIGRRTRGNRLEWCVPKGHPEGNENIAEAALREVAEETGLDCEIIEPLGSIDYNFQVRGGRIHKTVHHFLMRQVGGDLTIENDPDHEAVDIKWVKLDDLQSILAHENEKRMAQIVIEWVERNR